MPRTLEFNESTLDGRISMRDVVSRIREFPEVLSVERAVSEGPSREGYGLYRVTLRGEDDFDDPWLEDGGLQRLLSEFAFHPPAPPGEAALGTGLPLSEDARNRLIQAALSTTEGRSRLAVAMAAPLRTRLDYASIGRRVFMVEQMPEGALPVYDRDLGVGEMAVSPGWDSMGAEVPPREPPAWVQPGQWAFNARRDEYLIILERAPRGDVRAEVWRSPKPPRWYDVDFLYENCTPCEQPQEPKPVWDRLLGDDTL